MAAPHHSTPQVALYSDMRHTDLLHPPGNALVAERQMIGSRRGITTTVPSGSRCTVTRTP
jgi:hypothetical protein